MKSIMFSLAIAGVVTMSACSRTQDTESTVRQQQRALDSMNMELAKSRIVDSMNEVARYGAISDGTQPNAALVAAPAAAAAATRNVSRTPARRTSSSSSSSSSAGSRSAAQQPVVYEQTPVVQEKRGWSAKAKGAVIGTATGAAAGAIINKRNRGAGAVIGGVLGAAAGTGAGAVIDKKNGR
jgi:hypothetical protein